MKENSKAAKKLLSAYSIEEILEAVQYAKQMYIKEGKNPRQFIPNLQAVSNSIASWRGALKELKEKEKKTEVGYGYF